MADRSSQEVRRELQSERERLGKAIRTFRTKAVALRRKLPILAVGAAGASLLLRTASKRVFGRKPPGTEKRARFSFLHRRD
jgi:hypothetical protein